MDDHGLDLSQLETQLFNVSPGPTCSHPSEESTLSGRHQLRADPCGRFHRLKASFVPESGRVPVPFASEGRGSGLIHGIRESDGAVGEPGSRQNLDNNCQPWLTNGSRCRQKRRMKGRGLGGFSSGVGGENGGQGEFVNDLPNAPARRFKRFIYKTQK